MKTGTFKGLFVVVFIMALLFRVARLDLRPMHHDESNQAVKFGSLLEKGEYRYDPKDHHGPSLYYLSLPFAWLASGKSFVSLNETTLRLVPALFGVGILFLLLLMADGLSKESILFAGLFAAISPAMVYFSRFYIQEMLLVFFLAGALAAFWRYSQTRSALWAAIAGFFCGMMYATKETSVILFGSLLGAFAFSLIFHKKSGIGQKGPFGSARIIHLLFFLAAAVLPPAVLFSSFFGYPNGIGESVLAFRTYFERAGGAGLHSYPWYYYLRLLVYSHPGNSPVWGETFVLAMALVGIGSAFGVDPGKGGNSLFIRFIFFFTLLTAIIYSAIPYKTPWNLLPFYMGIMLLAGNGVAMIWRASRFRIVKVLSLFVLAPGFLNLGVQSYRSSFVFESDPRNPYVYAQTSPDFMKLVGRMNELALIHPDHEQMLIKVIAPPEDIWPLPWYLRKFTRVGYWPDAAAAGEVRDAAVIISSLGQAETLAPLLADDYQAEHFGLRPDVLLVLHMKKELWHSVMRGRPRK